MGMWWGASAQKQATPYALARGLRKIIPIYTGASFRATRSSDDAETDVYFDGNGITDSSLVSVGGNYGTWRGSDTIKLVRLYDQSGNGNHGVMSDPIKQPIT